MNVQYFKMQWKRAWHYAPYVLGYLLLMSIIFSILMFACSRLLTNERLAGKMNIGVVLPEDDETAKFAVSLVTSMDSVSSICQFTYYAETDGKAALQNQQIYALVVIPEHFVSDIMSGINTPIRIVTLQNESMEKEIFKEFADAGISMLGYAQMGIYTVWDYCSIRPTLEQKNEELNTALNRIYMKYALSRIDLFEEQELSATGDLSILEYYVSAGVVFLWLLLGIPLAFYFLNQNQTLIDQLRIRGIGLVKQTVITFISVGLSYMCIWCTLYAVPYILEHKDIITIHISLRQWLDMMVPILSILSFLQVIYTIWNEKTWGILNVFFLSIGMVFCSGGFIPKAFLPKLVNEIAKFLPTTYWIGYIGNAISANWNITIAVINISIMLICIILSCCIQRIRVKKSMTKLFLK